MYGLVPMSYLAKTAALKTPTFDSIITLASIASETDYWSEGITLQKLGLNNMTLAQMTDHVNHGT